MRDASKLALQAYCCTSPWHVDESIAFLVAPSITHQCILTRLVLIRGIDNTGPSMPLSVNQSIEAIISLEPLMATMQRLVKLVKS